jgi:hypothetical protein
VSATQYLLQISLSALAGVRVATGSAHEHVRCHDRGSFCGVVLIQIV